MNKKQIQFYRQYGIYDGHKTNQIGGRKRKINELEQNKFEINNIQSSQNNIQSSQNNIQSDQNNETEQLDEFTLNFFELFFIQ